MKIKKIPVYLLLSLLTIGASLILGLLSFGGIFALWPVLPVAIAAFGLAVAYEGEIYFQNIRSAFNKLLKSDYLKHSITKKYLLKIFKDLGDGERPVFFKDYQQAVSSLHQFEGKNLKPESQAIKQRLKKTTSAMEKWFANQLFANQSDEKKTAYQQAVIDWIKQTKLNQDASSLLKKRIILFVAAGLFSTITALFVGFGTSYLLIGTISTIPLLAAIPAAFLPALIISMSIIAGVAYGLLTYNAVTDMINNETMQTWYQNLKQDYQRGFILKNIAITLVVSVLLTLAITLTVCTAGTWWTVVKTTPKLFKWMTKVPDFITGIFNPIISGIAALIFTLQNTAESLTLFRNVINDGSFKTWFKVIKKVFDELKSHENAWQLANPGRILFYLFFYSLRFIFFLGHVISFGVTTDRMPGIPAFLAAVFGTASEAVEDFHFFFGHDEHAHEGEHPHAHEDSKTSKHDHFLNILSERLKSGHGHDHSDDLPSKLIKMSLFVFAFAAIGWDWWFSRYNIEKADRLTFDDAWDRIYGHGVSTAITLEQKINISNEWTVEHAYQAIDKWHAKNSSNSMFLINPTIKKQKNKQFINIQLDLKKPNKSTDDKLSTINAKLKIIGKNSVLNQHRLFSLGQKTNSARFKNDLSDIVNRQDFQQASAAA